jgi:hypothetical protein
MKKKAQSDIILNWAIWRIAILMIVASTLLIIIMSSLTAKTSSHEIENLILINRLINSPDLLAYRDQLTGRVYPGTIDMNKFSSEHLEKVLENENKRIAVNIELTGLGSSEPLRVYVNEDRAKIWDDYVIIGGFQTSSLSRMVRIYHENGKFSHGVLKIKVLEKV